MRPDEPLFIHLDRHHSLASGIVKELMDRFSAAVSTQEL